MIRNLFGLFAALLLCLPAHAAFPATPATGQCLTAPCYEYNSHSGSTEPWLRDPQTACMRRAVVLYTTAQNPSFHSFTAPTLCKVNIMDAGAPLVSGFDIVRRSATVETPSYSCPPNSTLSGSSCTCSSGYVEEGSSCSAPSVCDVGQGRTFNRTEGWARSANADADDLVVSFPPMASLDANDGTCVGSISRVDRCYRSQEPTAQGLYRLSCDYTMVITGESPPGSTVPETDPSTSNATCPGFVGQVNGKTVCVGTSSSPLPPPAPAPNQPTAPGNPSAGVKPSSGEGSGSDGPGRTPSVGIGGNSGGPASSAVGAGGTGDRDSDGEDPAGAVCGASPLPPCAVKVDETGTPAEGTAEGRFSQANTDLGKVQTDANTAFGDIQDIALPSWTWTFAFPTGCTPLVLPAFDDFEIDVCQFQPIIHDLMSVIWVIAGIWGLIALFRNASGV